MRAGPERPTGGLERQNVLQESAGVARLAVEYGQAEGIQRAGRFALTQGADVQRVAHRGGHSPVRETSAPRPARPGSHQQDEHTHRGARRRAGGQQPRGPGRAIGHPQTGRDRTGHEGGQQDQPKSYIHHVMSSKEAAGPPGVAHVGRQLIRPRRSPRGDTCERTALTRGTQPTRFLLSVAKTEEGGSLERGMGYEIGTKHAQCG